MKLLLLLFIVISVAAAYTVIDADKESNPGSKVRARSGVYERDPFPFIEPLGGFSDPKVASADAGVTSEKSPPSMFDTSGISSIFKLFEDSMRSMRDMTMSPFRRHFPDLFKSKPKTDEDPLINTGSSQSGTPGLLGSVFPDFEVVNPHFKLHNIHKLPPNYSNSTSEVHHSNDAKLTVNQTINKKSGEGFSKFFVVKILQLLPKNQTVKKDVVEPEVSITPEGAKDMPKLDTRLNEVAFKGEVDPLQEAQPGQAATDEGKPLNKERTIRRFRREISNQIVNSVSNTGNKPIEFLPSDLNRFPQSFLNNQNIKMEDLKNSLGGSISKSYVYKNIGGKTTFYIVNHKPKSEDKYTEAVGTNVVGGIPPPDLSRDTKVNPSGDNDQQQGLVLVHPDAEVFDLNLVAKEIESRPKDK